MAGMAGFEPTNARVKVWCLTAWRHPNVMKRCPASDTFGIIARTNPVCNHYFCRFLKNLLRKNGGVSPKACFHSLPAINVKVFAYNSLGQRRTVNITTVIKNCTFSVKGITGLMRKGGKRNHPAGTYPNRPPQNETKN